MNCFGYSAERKRHRLGDLLGIVLSNNYKEIEKLLNFLKETNMDKNIYKIITEMK